MKARMSIILLSMLLVSMSLQSIFRGVQGAPVGGITVVPSNAVVYSSANSCPNLAYTVLGNANGAPAAIRTSFTALGRIWHFYRICMGGAGGTAQGKVAWSSSADGIVWAASQNYTTSNFIGVDLDNEPISVDTNGTYAFLAYATATGNLATDFNVEFNYGKLAIDGSISWRTEVNPRGCRDYVENLKIDSSNVAYISIHTVPTVASGDCLIPNNASPEKGGVLFSSDYLTWTNSTLSTSARGTAVLTPLSNGKMYLSYGDGANGVFGRLFNGVTWGSEETVFSGGSVYRKDTNFFAGNSSSTLDNIYTVTRTLNGGQFDFASRLSTGIWSITRNVLPSSSADLYTATFSVAWQEVILFNLAGAFFSTGGSYRLSFTHGLSATWPALTTIQNITTSEGFAAGYPLTYSLSAPVLPLTVPPQTLSILYSDVNTKSYSAISMVMTPTAFALKQTSSDFGQTPVVVNYPLFMSMLLIMTGLIIVVVIRKQFYRGKIVTTKTDAYG